MIAFEHEPADGELGLTPDMEKVSAFLDLAERDPGCSLMVLNTKFLRNKRVFSLALDERFKVLKLSEVNRPDLLKACVSHGHMSVFFVPQNPDEMVRQFERLRFYGPGMPVGLSNSDAKNPLSIEGSAALAHFLASNAGRITNALFGFSHDAGQFYRVYPWQF